MVQSKPALIYCRVSGKAQEEEGTSLESQEAACVKHAESLGYTVERITRETYSGVELWDRPKLSKDREAIRAGQFRALIAYATDRLSRDPIHLSIIADDCERGEAELIFVTEPLDNSDEGKLLRYVKGYAAKKEHEKIRERTMRGKYQQALNGKIHRAGRELFGYRRHDGVRVIYEPEAAIIRRIYHLLTEERLSCHIIAKRFNKEGVPAPGSSYREDRVYWYASSVSRLARKTEYKGEGYAWAWVGVKRPGHKRLSKQRPAEEHIKLPDGVVPAIVSPETWETAQHCITHWSTDTARNATSPYLLRGMIYCERCEQERGRLRKMHTYWRYKNGNDPTSPKIRCYRCTSFNTPLGPCGAPSIRAEQIEAEVWATLCKTLRHPELVAKAVERQRQAGTDTNLKEDLAKAERAIARLEGKQQELLEKYTASEDDAFPWELVQREVRRLEKEKREWEHTARQVEHRMQRQEAEAKQLLHVQEYCRRVTANLETADFDMRVEILRALHIKVIAQGSQWHALGLLRAEEVYQIEQTPS